MPKIIHNVREMILDHANKILKDEGRKSLNIRNIAYSCDIGVGTFYNYFPSKSDLFFALYQKELQLFCDEIEEVSKQNLDFESKMHKIFHAMTVFFRSCEIYQIHSNKSKDELLRERIGNRSILSRIEEWIEEEERRGSIHSHLDAEKLTEFLLSNLIYLYQRPYLDFEQLYGCFNLFIDTSAGGRIRNYMVVS